MKCSKLQASLVMQLCSTPCQDQQRREACSGWILDETEASLVWKPVITSVCQGCVYLAMQAAMQKVSLTFEAPLCSLAVLEEAPVAMCTRLFHSTLGFAVLLMVSLGVNKQPSKRSVSAEMPEARGDLCTLPGDCSCEAMSASASLLMRRMGGCRAGHS